MAKNGSGAGAAILIVGALAVLLLFSSTIIGFVSGLPDQYQGWIEQLQDFINQIRGGLPGGGSGNFTGAIWIGYTVFFTDGSYQEIRQNPPALSLVPLSISFNNKEVSSIRVDLKTQLTSTKVISDWNATVGMRTEAFKMSDPIPRTAKTSAIANYTKSGSSWSSGETKVLASYTVSASQLENIVFTYGDGAWLLEFFGIVTLNVHVDGVAVDLPMLITLSGGMDFNYLNSAPQSLSVFGKCEHFGM